MNIYMLIDLTDHHLLPFGLHHQARLHYPALQRGSGGWNDWHHQQL